MILYEKDNKLKDYVIKYLSYYNGQKKYIIFSILLGFVQVLSLAPIALLIQRFFDVTLKQKNINELLIVLSLIFVLLVINSFSMLWNRQTILKLVKSIIYKIRRDLIFKIIFSKRDFYSSENLDKIHSQIVHDSERLDCMTSAFLSYIIPSSLITFSLSLILITINSLLFSVVIFILIILFFITIFLGRKISSRVRLFHSDYDDFSNSILFLIKFNDLIKISSNQQSEYNQKDLLINNLKLSSAKMAWLSTLGVIVQSNCLILSGVVVLLLGGMQVINNVITGGELLSFYVILSFMGNNARSVINNVPVVIEGKNSLLSIMPLILDNKYNIVGLNNHYSNVDLNTIKVQESIELKYEEIIFKDVFFKYEKKNIFEKLNLTIKKSQIICLTGESGSGKTTVISLLLGFYTPDKGEIFIDGFNAKDLPFNIYLNGIGVVLQEHFIFSGSIRENLIYGLENISDNKIKEICKLCYINDFIESLEHGYDTYIGERGVKISGGQKQRITIARALLRNPKLLILDEPDNNLDEDMTNEIINNIRKLNITTLIVTHNKNIYHNFDIIYKFENGTIITIQDKTSKETYEAKSIN